MQFSKDVNETPLNILVSSGNFARGSLSLCIMADYTWYHVMREPNKSFRAPKMLCILITEKKSKRIITWWSALFHFIYIRGPRHLRTAWLLIGRRAHASSTGYTTPALFSRSISSNATPGCQERNLYLQSKYYSVLGAGEYLGGGVRKEERLTIRPLEAGWEALHALLLARIG
jgi:hypothetical protein